MATNNNPGMFSRLYDLVSFVVTGFIVYVVSMVVLMSMRGMIISAAGETTFTAIFGAWVLITLVVIAALK